MPPDYEQCLENLAALCLETSSDVIAHRNEATTRLHLIDRLLFECLGWDKFSCTAEERHDGEYTDYSLGKPYVQLIVEAKREDIHFSLPSGFQKNIYSIARFKKEASDVYAAVTQAMRYCQSRGVPFGAVCNGQQIVAFLASRGDGTPPLQGNALVLPSLNHMKDDFRVLWDCLSPAGVSTRGLSLLLQERDQRPPPDKLATRIPKYPRYQIRNSIQSDLHIFGDLIIQDIGHLREKEESF